MVSLFSLLFLAGLKWINLNQLVPNTVYNLNNDNGYNTSPILTYFLISFVILAIAVVQFSNPPFIQSSVTASKFGGHCLSKISSIFAASPIYLSSSSMKPCMDITYTA